MSTEIITTTPPCAALVRRVGIIADGDAHHPMTMSGTPYFMTEALKRVFPEVVVLPCRFRWMESMLRYLNGGGQYLTGKRYSRAHSTLLAKLRSGDFAREAARHRCDLLFSAKDCKGIAYLPATPPVIYWTDATFRGMQDYYPSFRKLYAFSRHEGDLLEQRALRRAEAIVTLSDWARRSMIEDYQTPAEKISVFPFGPKLPHIDPDHAIERKPRVTQQLNLLWIGNKWERKGGRLAFETLLELKRRGIVAELTIIGSNPPEVARADGVRVIPFLDKANPTQLARLQDEYRRAHLFFLPSLQEAAGSVYLEATAFGVPSIACETGGVASMVHHDINGLLFPVGTEPRVYADCIQKMQTDPQSYWRLSRRTHAYHFSDANWGVWSNRIHDIAVSIFRSRTRPHERISA